MMQSRKTFESSIIEISKLISIATNYADSDYIFFKSSILLLCAKLEKFVKDSTREFLDLMLTLNLNNIKLPKKLLIEIIKNEVNKINEVSIEKYVTGEKYKERAKKLSLIWDSRYVLKVLEDDFSISISNNGTTAFQDVYKKVGLPDIIKNMTDFKVVGEQDKKLGIVSETNYSITNIVDKVIHLRHNIIHDDATPNLTQKDIQLYIEIFKDFVRQVDENMLQQISVLSK